MSVIDDFLTLIYLLFHWRILLCLIASCTTAYFAVTATHWLSFPQGFLIALFGLVPGSVLDDGAEIASGELKSTPQPTSILVYALSATVAGAIWGAASGMSVRFTIAGACVLAVASLGWFWYFSVKRREATMCVVLAAGCYIAAVLIENAL